MERIIIREKSIKTSVLIVTIAGAIIFLSSCGGAPSGQTSVATPKSPAQGFVGAQNPGGGTGAPAPPTVTIPAPVPSSKPVQQTPSQSASPIPVDNKYTASLVFSTATVKAGATFTIDVKIDSPVPTRGAQCALSFDPKVMKCEIVNEGTYYKGWATANSCTTMIFPQPKIDNGAGAVSDMGVSVMGAKEGGPTGSGILCTYKFSALGAGTVSATLSNALVADPTGKMAQAIIK